MAKLDFLLEGHLLGEYPLNKERTTIGRRPTNDIHIDNLAVSGEHAVIFTLGNDSFLEDLNSTNGTMVNQRLIKKHILQHNDIIEFGKYQLRFLNTPQERKPVEKKPNDDGFANTVLITPSVKVPEPTSLSMPEPAPPSQPEVVKQATVKASPQTDAVSESNQLSAETSAHTPTVTGPRLQILDGDGTGQAIPLDKTMVKLGKSGEQLALITKRQQGYFLTHVTGQQYPIVNEQPIGSQARVLDAGDVVEVAGVKMQFLLN